MESVVPRQAQLDTISATITSRLGKGPERYLFDFLIRQAKDWVDAPTRVDTAALDGALTVYAKEKMPGQVITHEYARQIASRLNGRLQELCQSALGKQLPFGVELCGERGNYSLKFYEIEARGPELNLLERFWRIDALRRSEHKRVRILYPEPQFFRDRNNTYFRHPQAKLDNFNDVFSYLGADLEIAPSFSFIPAGVVEAIIRLIEYFRKNGILCETSAVHPHFSYHEEEEDVVVLGTPTSNVVLPSLEEDFVYQTSRTGICLNQQVADTISKSYRKNDVLHPLYSDEEIDPRTGTKWALITRYQHMRGRATTIISATHGRTVQGVVRYLTRMEEIESLSGVEKKLGFATLFPERFQIIMETKMKMENGESHIRETTPRVAINQKFD